MGASTWRRHSILWALYFVQGLPYGFQVTALPVYLRGEGVSLAEIGWAAALSLPWMLKFLWAPWVDRHRRGPLGPRRSWILPLQGLLAATCFVASFVIPQGSLTAVLVLVLAMNLAAATLDIAVDGLAVDFLRPDELGLGNVAQVVGFKFGMLTGGGVLLWASAWIGWSGLFQAMAGLMLLIAAVTLTFREPAVAGDAALSSLGKVLGALRGSLAGRGFGWLLLLVVTYKMGESLADTMFRPFLVDHGFTARQIGAWVGTWGVVFSIAGSAAGGLLAWAVSIRRAVIWTAVLRALPLAGLWWLSVSEVDAAGVIAVTCAENFFGGALTVALFAYMMSQVDRRIGATHFTLLAALEVFGKIGASTVSGMLAEATSYSTLFGIATVLSVLFWALLPTLRRPRADESEGLGPQPIEP
ncbi:MAG: MFS transporter [Acidobacteriota bacterium]